MRIYNYLFYKTYQLAQRSRNFDDTPVLGGIMFVIGCVMFNIFTISFLLGGFGIVEVSFEKEYEFLFVLVLMFLIWLYYYSNDRYKKIIQKYENMEKKSGIGIHPILVIIVYFGISFGLLLLSGLFRNRDWIFASLPVVADL